MDDLTQLCDAVLISGDHTKALIGQLIIFNQILGELREDIREQVRLSLLGYSS